MGNHLTFVLPCLVSRELALEDAACAVLLLLLLLFDLLSDSLAALPAMWL
jgi:hypothetical protein